MGTRVLVTGADGRLGQRVVAHLEDQGHTVIASVLKQPDIVDLGAVMAYVDDAQPEFVMHFAALTDVDFCARSPDEALRVNGIGTQHVALACQKHGIPMLYVSTNEVFDGERGAPYLEYDTTRPINPYGYSKWVGEQVVRQLLPQHMIVRISWLFAHDGGNFLQKIVGAARTGKPLTVVTDEVASPTYADDLAPALCQLVFTRRFGTYHLVNEGAVSRYQFARFILDSYGLREVPITPIVKAQFNRPSRPPTYSVLRNFQGAHIGIRLRHWQQAVEAFVAREAQQADDPGAQLGA